MFFEKMKMRQKGKLKIITTREDNHAKLLMKTNKKKVKFKH